jgi:hypothetical protein
MPSMKKIAVILAFAMLMLYAGVLTLAAFFLWEECHDSDALLHMLAAAKPGVRISEIREKLGPQDGMFTDVKDMLRWGTMEDESFCRGKKLFQFRGVLCPYRTVWVYTDANDAVVYATWKSE